MGRCKPRSIGLSPTGKTHMTWELYSVPESLEQTTLAELTAEIVSAYVSHNQITPPELARSSALWPASFSRSAPELSNHRK